MQTFYNALRLYVFIYSWFHERDTRRHYGHRGYPIWCIRTVMENGKSINELLRYLERAIYGRVFCSQWSTDWVEVPKLWYIRAELHQKRA